MIFTYRWNIPKERWNDFCLAWAELTTIAATDYGLHKAVLYQVEKSEHFVSIAHWQSAAARETWLKETSGHPFRTQYRPFKVSGPEVLSPLVVISLEDDKI